MRTSLSGKVGTTAVIQLSLTDTDTDSYLDGYTVTTPAGGSFSLDPLGGVSADFSGGNKNYVNILDVSGSLDLVLSASDGSQARVNTSANAIGVGNGPTIASGDTLTINLYDNVAGSSGKFDDPPTTGTGSLNPVQLTSFSFTVATVQGNSASTTSFKVTYIDGNGDLQTIDYPESGQTLTAGSVITINDANGISQVNIIGVTGTTPFGVTLGSNGSVPDVLLDIPVIAADVDGDTATGTIRIGLDQDGTLGVSGITSAPIAIDLDGDGIEYLGLDAGVTFDGDSTDAIRTAWVAAGDALLVFDANNSGTVDESREYVFTEWAEAATSDMAALREVFDTNQDDVLDASDDNWDQFKVWQDANSDGVTDEGELKSLDEAGITSIALTYNETSESSSEAGWRCPRCRAIGCNLGRWPGDPSGRHRFCHCRSGRRASDRKRAERCSKFRGPAVGH